MKIAKTTEAITIELEDGDPIDLLGISYNSELAHHGLSFDGFNTEFTYLVNNASGLVYNGTSYKWKDNPLIDLLQTGKGVFRLLGTLEEYAEKVRDE